MRKIIKSQDQLIQTIHKGHQWAHLRMNEAERSVRKSEDALDMIHDICTGQVKLINHHLRILHILELIENYRKTEGK